MITFVLLTQFPNPFILGTYLPAQGNNYNKPMSQLTAVQAVGFSPVYYSAIRNTSWMSTLWNSFDRDFDESIPVHQLFYNDKYTHVTETMIING